MLAMHVKEMVRYTTHILCTVFLLLMLKLKFLE